MRHGIISTRQLSVLCALFKCTLHFVAACATLRGCIRTAPDRNAFSRFTASSRAQRAARGYSQLPRYTSYKTPGTAAACACALRAMRACVLHTTTLNTRLHGAIVVTLRKRNANTSGKLSRQQPATGTSSHRQGRLRDLAWYNEQTTNTNLLDINIETCAGAATTTTITTTRFVSSFDRV